MLCYIFEKKTSEIYVFRKNFNVRIIKLLQKNFFQGSSFTKIRPQAKIDNFAFKNRNIIVLLKIEFERENIIFHEKNLKHKKIILLINYIFAQTYFLIALRQIFKNDPILVNHGSFF